MSLPRLLLLSLLLPLLSWAGKAPPAQPFQRLDGCTYLENEWNDGDSFHVRLPDGKEEIFRLYFVDTPESENSFPARVTEQAAYFGITPEQSLAFGKQATNLTRAALTSPFTVHTRWRKALGRSKLPRYYAIIITSTGQNLADLLVQRGVARIYGTRTSLPDGDDSRAYLEKLGEIETESKMEKDGAWKAEPETAVTKVGNTDLGRRTRDH